MSSDAVAKAGQFVAEVLFGIGHKVADFSRKRGENDEDHWYPRNAKQLGLLPHQCYHCGDILLDEPKRGCRGVWP